MNTKITGHDCLVFFFSVCGVFPLAALLLEKATVKVNYFWALLLLVAGCRHVSAVHYAP